MFKKLGELRLRLREGAMQVSAKKRCLNRDDIVCRLASNQCVMFDRIRALTHIHSSQCAEVRAASEGEGVRSHERLVARSSLYVRTRTVGPTV